MAAFPSDEWALALMDEVNASAEYAEQASDWEGDVVFLIQAEPDKGVPEDVYLLLDLWHGTCRGAGAVDAARGDRAEFLVSAPYSRWREVIEGRLDPVKALMQGKIKVRGDLQKILRYIRATQTLAQLSGTLDTAFPDA
jgi:putative sterol carrier protein